MNSYELKQAIIVSIARIVRIAMIALIGIPGIHARTPCWEFHARMHAWRPCHARMPW